MINSANAILRINQAIYRFLSFIILRKETIKRFLLISLIFISSFAYAKVDIINPAIRSDTVDFGMCLVGDSLETFYNIINPDKVRLKIGKTLPSFFLGTYGNFGLQFEEFREDFPTPFYIERIDKSIFFKYFAKLDLNKYPTGKKQCYLLLSLYDPDVENARISAGDSLHESDLIIKKEYYFIARKTLKYIDGFEKEINFDSVYVDAQTDTTRRFWKVQNSFNASLNVINDQLVMLSPVLGANPEFGLYNHQMPLNFPTKRTTVDWSFTYKPIDMNGDSAEYNLYFIPNPAFPSKFDTCSVKMYGMGVKQDIKLFPNNEAIKGDTINFGDVWVNSNKELEVIINNQGNIPFGCLKQSVTNVNNSDPSLDFISNSTLKSLISNLYPTDNDSIKISFTPNRRGPFFAKLVLESDIFKRKITGFPQSLRQVVFYIKGNGIEPTLEVDKDTIDFGNVVLQPDCPKSRDLTLLVSNNGNAPLIIFYTKVEPPFSVTVFDTLSANSRKPITLSFDANQLGAFTKTLTITTNANQPYTDFKLHLKAQSVAPKSMDIEIPKDLKAKPGTRIMFPILVKDFDIINAKTYSDTLEYDRSLLEYYDFDKVNTASEAAQAELIEFANGSKLSIKLSCPGNLTFMKSDTLIKLYYNTYLGEKVKTSINLTATAFGDGVCIGVLKGVPSNGIFSLDSVCGLEFKAIPRVKGIIQAYDIHPNPSIDNFNLTFDLSENADVSVKIYNTYGIVEKEYNLNKLALGSYVKNLELPNLEQGFFICEITAGLDKIALPLIIRK